MLKKTITYTDFNGEEVSEDFYFHLSKAELIELELSEQGGLSETLKRIVAAQDGKSIIEEFKKILLLSYGHRSPDGRRFVKNETIREEFQSSEAYSELFMELCTNAEAGAEFINGVIPKGLAEDAARTVALAAVPDASEPAQEKENPITETTFLTKFAVAHMTAEELAELGPRLTSGEVQIVD